MPIKKIKCEKLIVFLSISIKSKQLANNNYIQSETMRCKTVFTKQVLDDKYALSLYNFLKKNIEWEEGVRSKKGFTRKAKMLSVGDLPEVDEAVAISLSVLTKINYDVNFYYLNYYEDGNMWTPNHSHKGTHQLVISLGETRTLEVAKKSYKMENGDAVIFGSAIHGVPKDNSKNGRITIATFMVPSLNQK